MRNEQQVLDQLLSFARKDENVRAVILNGSRVNPNIAKDIFCDYDVIYVVRNPRPFMDNQGWIKEFGELVIMQQNDLEDIEGEGYIFLMQFKDGVRIDLTFHPIEEIDATLKDTLKLVLLDKDSIIGEQEPPNDSTYHIKKPGRQEFDDVMNNFWWCSTYIAKGLWRNQLSYVKYMFEVIVRSCIIKALEWHIASEHDWSIDTGKAGKQFKRYLRPELWEALVRTYAGSDSQAIWEAVFEAGRLMRELGTELADKLGYKYPIEDDERVTEYLRKVRLLPADANAFE